MYKGFSTVNDYYPGGMQMPGRKFPQIGSTYRYGFNGKENDNDVKGEGNQQDYGMRIYDPRLVRFLSVDPITKSYPELTPYQFASNTPIQAIDLDGLEKFIIHFKVEDGKNVILKQQTDNSLKYLSGPTVWNQPTLHPKVVQFIQEDASGKTLNVSSEIALKNFGSTLYVGPFNPKDADGNDTYSYPAINSLDLAGKKHDKAYDELKAKGTKGAFIDLATLPADKQLVKDAAGIVAKYYLMQKDPVNKEDISEETKNAALKVVKIFSVVVAEKTVRIAINKATKAVKETAKKVRDNIEGTLKEAESRSTPRYY